MSADTMGAHAKKPQLVLLHGWGMNAEVWQTIYSRLAAHFQVNIIDLPGYGLNPIDDPETLSDAAANIAAQFSHPVALLGWSLGGLIATQIAANFPEKVTHLINLAASPCFLAQPNWNGLNPELLARFQQQLLRSPKRTLEKFIALQTLGTKSAFEDSRFLRQLIGQQPLPSIRVLQCGLRWLQQSDLRPELMEIPVPVLMIYGELDHIVPVPTTPSITLRHPSSRIQRLAEAGHVPFVSHPDKVARIVTDFLVFD
jgi:pimeloyl-[acyl-carrier protein] methyl ester esterase